MRAPIKKPIVKRIIGSPFLNLVAWPQPDFGFLVIYMENILEGYGQNLVYITCNANAILEKKMCRVISS